MSLIFWDSNTLTALWVVGTLIFFWLFIDRHIKKRLWFIYKSIKELNSSFSPENIGSNKYLKKDWIAYSQTFMANEGKRKKTNEEASLYFNENSIVTNNLSVKILQTVPGTLVGFGILGTFVGLSFGITGFNTTSTNAIQKSIQLLLSGMGTAFVSSIWGMGLSIAFIYIEKYVIRKISHETVILCDILDDKFKLTKADEFLFAKEDQEQLFKDMFCYYDENQNLIRPSDYFRRIAFEAEQQTKALKSFSTDLADGIKISNETVIALGDHVGKLFESTLTNHLAPVFNNLDHAVDELIKTKEQSSEDVIKKVIDKLEESIVQIGSNFQSTLSDSALAQLNQVIVSLGQLEGSLSSIPQNLQQMMEGVQKSIELQQQTIQNTSSKASEETAAAVGLIKEQVEESAQKFKEIIGNLQSNMSDIFVNQKNSTESVDLLILSSNDIIEKAKILTEKMNQSIGSFDKNFNSLNNLATQITQTSTLLKSSSDKMNTTMEQFQNQTILSQNNNKEILKQLELSMRTAKEVASDYSQKFKIIHDGLQEVFSHIEKGLTNYQDAVHETLNVYLTDFTTRFSEAANSLSGSVDMLTDFSDSVEELVDNMNSVIKNNGFKR
jgi:hypothetical protein